MNREEQIRELLLQALTTIVHHSFSTKSFEAFFEVIYEKQVLKHWKEKLDEIFKAIEDEQALAIEAFRGSAKTTTFTQALAAYLIGKFPDKAGLLIQLGDESATDNSQQVADIIDTNPGWKRIYPYIIPDKTQGWGANGYEIKLTHRNYQDAQDNIPLGYPEWRRMCSVGKGKDPTFLALGYKSRTIIGKRPHWLIIDDINDENNTSSEREGRKVKKILTANIFPAANSAIVKIIIGTPWNEADALHYCLQTGQFVHIKIPVKVNGKLTWPQKFDEKRLEIELAMNGKIEYARMYELDLSKIKGLILKREWIHRFDHKYINEDWPRVIGIDYTSTEDPRKERGDFFSLCVGAIIPGNVGVVVEDGVRTKVSHAEAQDLTVAWVTKYPNIYAVGVEAIIAGQLFYNDLLNNAYLRAAGIVPIPVRFNKSKGYRYEKELAPLHQKGRIKWTDKELEFMTALFEEWISWEGDPLETNHPNDGLDSLYAMMRAAEVFVSPITAKPKSFGNPLYPELKPERLYDTIDWNQYGR